MFGLLSFSILVMYCNECNTTKDLEDFYGKTFKQCKECLRARGRKHYAQRPPPTPMEISEARLIREKRYLQEKEKRKQARLERKKRLAETIVKDKAYLRRYGLTPDSYKMLLQAQGSKCGVCGRVGDFVIDHDHVTGKVRGLLHAGCNSALGFLKDSPRACRGAAKYLEKFMRSTQLPMDPTSSSDQT